jgi:hypothetical protein
MKNVNPTIQSLIKLSFTLFALAMIMAGCKSINPVTKLENAMAEKIAAKTEQVLFDEEPECNKGDAYCQDGQAWACKNGKYVMVEDCSASNKMCDDETAKCVACEDASNQQPETALEITHDVHVKGVVCSKETPLWYKVEIPEGYTFLLTINDGFSLVYFDLLDNTNKKKIGQENEYGELAFTNTGADRQYLLKVYSEKHPYVRFHFHPQLLENYTPMIRPE